jgi:hydrogenase nickel incorporation protein HypB
VTQTGDEAVYVSDWIGSERLTHKKAMDTYKILKIKKSVYESNAQEAQRLRSKLKEDGIFLLNLMSSPGSGKTMTLVQTIAALKDELRIGVLEADIDSDVDARIVENAGAKAIQLHTGGMCHLDAGMTGQGLAGLGTEGLDLIFLENVGNLICTASFDTGAVKNAVILSVPEGDDKPLKYPHMFEVADIVLVNKTDTIAFFDFDLETFRQRVARVNPKAKIIPISAKTGDGIGDWIDWLRAEVRRWKFRGEE